MTSLILEKVGNAWKGADAENRSLIFAFAIVPLLTAAAATITSRAPLPYAIGHTPVSVVSVKSNTGDAGDESDAVVIVVQPEASSATLNVTPPPKTFLTSLSRKQAEANRHNLTPTAKGISIQAPFQETEKPVVIVTDGRAGETVTVDGHPIFLADAMLPATNAMHLAVTVLLCAAFALGLGFASSVSVETVIQDGSAE